MFDQLMSPALALAGFAAALLAGVFLTFSDFVMRALAAASPTAGGEAMQQINRKVYRSLFMILFLGSVPVAIVILFVAVSSAPGARVWMIGGALSYLLGVFAITGLGNVPMNNRLDRLDHKGVDGQNYWRGYSVRWTRLNHVRSVFAVLTSACYLVAATE